GPSPEAAGGAASAGPGATPEPPLVLVVDDEEAIRRLTRTFFARSGYRVALAANGREALELLRGGLRPAVLVVDLAMPVMDGRKLLAAVRADPELARIPAVIVSAYLPPDGLDLGFPVETIAKPANLRQLLDAVRRARGLPGE
ncbi:MAG TPA: response regulator, partial [Planctomycetota bacterium]|nr:response regulator [Planctomycetota bacterium]